ncbi:hypothetical protein HYG81_16755 [Natrinema zhouii]|uniref:Uncharacterized protein n=1 Tax=Natrinema zhouii TaxID=1710539 RepID=A0A7D6CQN9_9EURY|nr:hypothetical protein [Natrinema zhouii]QLK25710.1 hypothetical protein HYG81_16755 [Natrinema zhouii]
MRTVRLAVAVLLCSLLGVAGVATVAGAPPPTQLCGVCGDGLAGERGIDGSTEPGTLDIYVDDAGDSHWQARVPITDSAAERYRTNTSALEAAVDDAWTRYHGAEGDVHSVETALENETVVVNYTVDDVARRGVGETWLVDYFAVGTSNTRYVVAADRVTIHTPEGTAVTNRPSRASVDGNAATWTQGGGFDRQTYVTYGSAGVLGTASGYATIALEVGPTALDHGIRGGVVPGILIGLVGVTIGRSDWGSAAVDAATLERLIVAVGSVGAVGFLVIGAVSTDAGLAPGAVVLASLGVGYALLGCTARRLGSRLETRGLIGLSALATIVAAGTTLLFAGPPVYAFPLCFGLATALCLPIGHASERGRRPVGPIAVAALTPVAAIAAVAPVSVFGYGPTLYGLLLLPWVATVTAFGYPLALLGRRLAIGLD